MSLDPCFLKEKTYTVRFRYGPLPVAVNIRIITFLLGDVYKTTICHEKPGMLDLSEGCIAVKNYDLKPTLIEVVNWLPRATGLKRPSFSACPNPEIQE